MHGYAKIVLELRGSLHDDNTAEIEEKSRGNFFLFLLICIFP